ncbi:efflux RND transporter periplasmic adaptor subunit [Sporosarcina sp. FSL K6-1522]|uniref:efflux RND transporter periplasmic adaptor subunit n=1 Tax=Sporosarcina sp. FSL K6-1522 TaxID=2921554 RepID=UPI00315AAAA0
MNKVMNIAIGIAVIACLTVNLYLIFSDKSVIPKSVYVKDHERMTSGNYREKIAKEGFVAPAETYTVYVGNEDVVDSWLVKEGDQVIIGQELASLQTEQAEGQLAVWRAEREAILQQQSSARRVIADLESQLRKMKSASTANTNRKDTLGKNDADTKVAVGFNVDVEVDIKEEGAFAQAISAAERELADLERQLIVIDTQLSQNPSHPALVSPVEGVVSDVVRRGSTLAVDIYSSQKDIVTYAKNHEWQQIVAGNRVLVKGEGVEPKAKGTVSAVSTMPATDNDWFNAYKAFDNEKVKNPLAYYEVRVSPETTLESVPFGTNVKADIIVDEALEATSVKEKWLQDFEEKTAFTWKIDNKGLASKVDIVTPFTLKDRAIVTEGLQRGDIAVYAPAFKEYEYAPRVFLSLPSGMPAKEQWRAFGWKNYVKYMLVK